MAMGRFSHLAKSRLRACPPILDPAFVAERSQLIEEMVKAFMEYRAVRIVDPLRGRSDMKDRTCGISLSTQRSLLDGGLRADESLSR